MKRITMLDKVHGLKDAFGEVVDALADQVEAEQAIERAVAKVPQVSVLVTMLERYLRTDHAACEGCGKIKDVDSLELGRCAECEAGDARQ